MQRQLSLCLWCETATLYALVTDSVRQSPILSSAFADSLQSEHGLQF